MRRASLVGVVVALAIAGCTGGEDVADFGPGRPSDAAPVLPGDDGLDLADAVLVEAGWPQTAAWIRRETEAGRPVVVNFFASWCEPCTRELPLLIATAAAEEDIVFLGVNHVDQRPLAEDVIDEYGVDYPTLFDPAGDIVAEVGGRGLPHTVAFDRDGHLVSRVFGELSETSLDRLLAEVR